MLVSTNSHIRLLVSFTKEEKDRKSKIYRENSHEKCCDPSKIIK